MFKEMLINNTLEFPLDVFIQDSNEEFVTNDIHFHDCFEVIFMIGGGATQDIADKSFTISKNDLVIISPSTPHAMNYLPDIHTRNITIKFLPELLMECFPSIRSKYILPFVNNENSSIIHIDVEDPIHQQILDRFVQLHKEYVDKQIGYEVSTLGILLQILSLLFRTSACCFSDLITKSEIEFDSIEQFCQYIEDHYMEGISLQSVADEFHYSYTYLSKILKKTTGKTFSEYLNFVRVCEFEKRFKNHNESISEAAHNVGFNSVANLNKVYRKIRGCTPTDFLKRKQREIIEATKEKV